MKKVTPTFVIALYLLLSSGGGWTFSHNAYAEQFQRTSNSLIIFTERGWDKSVKPTASLPYGSQAQEEEFAHALNTIIEASATGFTDLRGGPGKKIEDAITYPCTVSLPGSTKMSVWIPQGEEDLPYVSAGFYAGNDIAEGEKIFSNLVTKIRAALPMWETKEKKTDTPQHTHRYYFEPKEKNVKVLIDLDSFKSTGNVNVHIYISKSRTGG
jgi:hypothetical protein